MRHKYSTQAIVLARSPLAEAGVLVTILTPELGLIRARAEGLRRSGAKLAHALQTLDESEVMLVRGKDGWRLTGAVLAHSRFALLESASRARTARIASLLLKLVRGEAADPVLYGIFVGFIEALPELTEEQQDAAECLAALRVLAVLGLDSGEVPGLTFDEATLATAHESRHDLVSRINRGIAASGM